MCRVLFEFDKDGQDKVLAGLSFPPVPFLLSQPRDYIEFRLSQRCYESQSHNANIPCRFLSPRASRPSREADADFVELPLE